MLRQTVVILSVVIAITSQTKCFADLSDGLIAHFSFDDGAGLALAENSGSGSTTDGFLVGFDGDDSQWVEGQVGGALEFDGIDDFVIVPEYELAQTGFSVSIWGYVNGGEPNDAPTWASLVKNWGGAVVGQFHFGLGEGGADTLNIFITDSDGQAFNAGTDMNDVAFDEWQHFAFVADPTEEIVSLYRDGFVVDERPYNGAFTDTPNSTALGIGVKTNDAGDMADPGAPGYWDGKLDDLGIWNRALTAEEVLTVWAGGTVGIGINGQSTGCDLNVDGACDIGDIDELLYLELGGDNQLFDLDSSGTVDLADRDLWLSHEDVGSFPGDFDLSGEVNASDLNTLGGNWQATDLTSYAQGDSNGDGIANATDLNALGSNWQAGVAPAASLAATVPEPAGIILTLFGLVGLTAVRRTR